MANWDTLIVGSAPTVTVRLVMYETGTNVGANTSSVHWEHHSITGSGSRTGTWDWNYNVNGNTGSGSTGGTHAGDQILAQGDITVGHDANGYGSCGGSAFLDAFFGSGTASGTLGLTRLALAPTISSITADTIKPNSARLGAELSTVGHGTSANLEMFYRLQGAGGWTSLGVQGDAAGYNYWNATGLQSGKTYEYYASSWNNNGDTTNSGTQTFVTKLVPGMVPILLGLIG